MEDDDQVLILNGDIPLIKKESLEKFIEFHNKTDSACTILSTIIEEPKGYGRIIRNENTDFLKITEDRDLNPGQETIKRLTWVFIFLMLKT